MIRGPTVVCLCGSTRFGDAFRRANLEETFAGRIVLTVGCDFKSDDALGLSADVKAELLNVGGYVGSSTQREIAYAIATGKFLRWLEPDAGEAYLEANSHALGDLVAKLAMGRIAVHR